MDARNLRQRSRRPSHVTMADFGLPVTPNTRAKAFLDSLPILALADLRLDCLECPFCIEPYQNSPRSERPVRLPCNHVMGKDCLKKWLNSSESNANNNACPTCRAVLFKREDELDDISEDEIPPPEPQSSAVRDQLVDLRRDVRWYSIGPEHLRTQGQYEQIRDALLAFEATADIISAAEANVLRLDLEQASVSAEYRMWRRRREHDRESERLDRSNDTVSGLLARGRAYETPTYRVRDRIPERPDPIEDSLRPVLLREGGRAEGIQSQMQINQDLGTLPERLSPRYPSRNFGGLGRGDTEAVGSRSRLDQSHDMRRELRDPREDALRPVLVTGRLRAEAAANRVRTGYAGMSSTRMRGGDLAE